MPQTSGILYMGCQVNSVVQVLLAIMSGVFGLAGWHFCKLLGMAMGTSRAVIPSISESRLTAPSALSNERFL